MSSPLLSQLGVIAVASVVMFYPGGLVAALLGVRRALPAYLQPAVALSFGLTIVGVLLVPALWLQLSAQVVLWALVGLTAVLALYGMGRARRLARERGDETGMPGLRWLYDSSPVSWFAALPIGMLVLCAVTATIAFVLGGWIDDGDMMYHTAIARKLAELGGPTFANIQLFVDGSLHPGYFAPPWHEMVALTSVISGADVATVMWVMAVPAAVVALLTIAGLAFVLLRSHLAAFVAGVLFIVIDSLVREPLYGAIPAAVAPSAFSMHVLLPLALASWVIALWHPQGSVRRAGLVALLFAALPALFLVHASYVAFLGMMIAGYLVVWALRAPWPRETVVRHAMASIALAGFTAAGLVAMAPVLRRLVTFDPGQADLALRSEVAEYSHILVGSASSFHLRPDVVVWFGGLALAGALCAVLAFRYLREPVAWLIIGATTLVLVTSQFNELFVPFSKVMSTHQSKRIQYALPYGLSLTLGIMFAGSSAARAWQGGRRLLGAGVALLSGGALAAAAYWWEPLPSIKSDPTMPMWPVRALLYVALVGAAALVIDLVLRTRRQRSAARRVRDSTAMPKFDSPVVDVGPGAARGVACVLVLACSPIVVPATAAIIDAGTRRPSSALYAYDLRRVDPAVVRELRRQPQRVVVMSPLRLGLRLEAVAPVYVVGVRLTHVARTKRNRATERRDAVNAFFDADAGDDERFAILRDERAQYVVTPLARTSVVEFLDDNPDRFVRLARGRHQAIYHYVAAEVL